MREILFRGKRLDNGEWVEGFFSSETFYGHTPEDGRAFIIQKGTGFYCPVAAATVGQFIGLVDKHGKRIFEGHVLLVIRGGRKYVCAIKDARNLPDCMFGSSVESAEIVSDIWDPIWQKEGGRP